ncbi:uncharacterized protein isoform X2 [Choristoneura fumiferana]
MKIKFIKMNHELTADVMAKIDEIENLRLKESKTTAYRQGELAYHARRKWTQMLRIYFKCVKENATMESKEMIKDLTTLQRLDMDIYHATENMNQLEDDGEDVPFHDERRRSGTGRGRSNNRRYLASAHSALREKVRKQNERLRNIYHRTSPSPVDVYKHLQFLYKNNSDVLLVPKKFTGTLLDSDPEFLLPFIYE